MGEEATVIRFWGEVIATVRFAVPPESGQGEVVPFATLDRAEVLGTASEVFMAK
jgi:hypothetical protein